MSKKKSVVLLVIYTLLIAALCFICTVSFSYGTDNLYTFSSVMRMMEKDADLGIAYGANADAGTYLGGGYSAVYYPEGVISAKEFDDNTDGMSEDEAAQYAADYVRYPDENGSVYLEKGVACDDNGAVLDSFRTAFDAALATVTARYAGLRADGARVESVGDYAIGVFLPAMMDGEYTAISVFAYTGELSIRAGSDEASATDVFTIRPGQTIRDYVKKITSRSAGDTAYVEFTNRYTYREALKTATAGAADTAVTLFFNVGETNVIQLSVSEVYDPEHSLHQRQLHRRDGKHRRGALLHGARRHRGRSDAHARRRLLPFGALRQQHARHALYRIRRVLRGNDGILLRALSPPRVCPSLYLSSVPVRHDPVRLVHPVPLSERGDLPRLPAHVRPALLLQCSLVRGARARNMRSARP